MTLVHAPVLSEHNLVGQYVIVGGWSDKAVFKVTQRVGHKAYLESSGWSGWMPWNRLYFAHRFCVRPPEQKYLPSTPFQPRLSYCQKCAEVLTTQDTEFDKCNKCSNKS
jgi:hypothetical protein